MLVGRVIPQCSSLIPHRSHREQRIMFLRVRARVCVKMPPLAWKRHPAGTLHDVAEQVAVIHLLLREATAFERGSLAHLTRAFLERIKVCSHVEQGARRIGKPDVEREPVVVQPAGLARRDVVRIGSPRHRALERRLGVQRASGIEHNDGIAGQFLRNQREGAAQFRQGVAMQERALDSAIQVMAGNVVERTVTQVHADSLHVRDFYEVRIVACVFHPLLGCGTEPQGFRRLRRNKRTVRTLRKNRCQKTYDKNKKEPRSTAGMSIKIFSLVFRLSSLV